MSTVIASTGFSLMQITALARNHYGLTGKFKILPGELDLNAYLETDTGAPYILKIAHRGEDLHLLQMQHALMQHLQNQDLALELPEVIANNAGEGITIIEDQEGQERYLRLLTWLPGDLWASVKPHTTSLLESLGEICGELCRALSDFDHPAAHRNFKWNLSQGRWIKEALAPIGDAAQLDLVKYFLNLYEQEVAPRLPHLRESVHHNDANDYNILVSTDDLQNRRVIGLIDFGDTAYSHTINDLAIAVAYACMDQPDPLGAAAAVVKGFHRTYPLLEAEIAVIFPLIALRLCVSVTNSAENRTAEPDNEYLLISERPAWNLLQQLRQISPALAHYTFRHACGLAPCPKRPAFDQWLAANRQHLGTVVDLLPTEKLTTLDLSVGSLDLGHNDHFGTIAAFQQKITRLLDEKEATAGVGGYGEVRPFYTTDAYQVTGNNGPRWRTVHLGLDIWAAAGSAVLAPMDGVVFSVQDNAGERDYGPTIILEHQATEALSFYTLYGHLSRRDLPGLKVGQSIAQGQPIAHIGPPPENGNWPPHLHFQVILDLLGSAGDFPGVAFPETREIWLGLCPDPELLLKNKLTTKTTPHLSKTAILDYRREHLGKNLSVSYQDPLHIVRGYRQYLYDQTGRRYLDTVNNVPHVGHQHPRVVRAAQRQMELLNTNTRYLHENIILFAEELLAMFPPELSVCHFVNSGSEANELALRMARTYSRQKDMIVLEVGYHGNTGGCIDISSYKFDSKGGSGAPPTTHVVPMPDIYRGPFRSETPEAGKQYADFVAKAIEKVKANGRGIAGFIAESILSCGGQIVLPPGYLEAVYQHVHAAGGLCIADEVQVGFGRVGAHFWGFELQGVVPDIVTMGKPIGNGHPLAAVVTTQAVADAFANGMEYFNTFGGNPVSCAIGREVLQIVKDENLQQHALKIGDYLLQGLRDLQKRHPLIGDVRGHGLFLGFEMVKNRETLEPAEVEATYLANRMREHGILMSTDGPLHNVLKIKPPMCFDRGNADFLLKTLDEVLAEDFLAKAIL